MTIGTVVPAYLAIGALVLLWPPGWAEIKKQVPPIPPNGLLAIAEFADVYVRKVIPAWIKERRSQSAEAVDHGWGSAGLRAD